MTDKQFSLAANGSSVNNQRSLSVEQWHRLALDGACTSVNLKLSGASMQPLIRKEKDTVTVVPVFRELKCGDIVLVSRADGVYVVHRVRKITVNSVQTLGDRCVAADDWMPLSAVWGMAVRLERNGRTVNLDSAFSRVYGRIHMSTRPVRSLWRKLLRFAAQTVKRVKGKR